MAKYFLLVAALMLMVACGGDDGSDSVDDDSQPDTESEQPDTDTTPTWVTDQTYAGLEWSTLSEEMMNWQEAVDYCIAMGARLPNINELRKIIINCPGSTYGGACQISDPDCLTMECLREDCRCDGSAESYSALGDGKGIHLWSSSFLLDVSNGAWRVSFVSGDIDPEGKDNGCLARCVR